MKKNRISKQYSIAEARDQLARVVHEAEKGASIELTRRGEPVAVMISLQEYQHFRQEKGRFWERFQEFRKRHKADKSFGLSDELQVLRDSTPGRDVDFDR